MRYSEFKAEVEKLGYIVKNKNEAHIYVSDADGLTIARVGKLHAVEMATDFMRFTTITRLEHKLLIYTHCKNLAETPLAEREEEKRYWLQRIEPPILGEQGPRYLFYTPRYLFYTRVGGYYDIGTTKSEWRNVIKTIFTESEIAQMDITGFEKIRVME